MEYQPLTFDKVENWLEETMEEDMEPVRAYERDGGDDAPSTSSSSAAPQRSLRSHFTTARPAEVKSSSKVNSSQRGYLRGGRNGRGGGRGRRKSMPKFHTLLPTSSQKMVNSPNTVLTRVENPTSSAQHTTRSAPRMIPPALSKTSTPLGLGGQTGTTLLDGKHPTSIWGSTALQPSRSRAPQNPLELVINTSRLPENVSCTTWTFYQLFEQYGNISYIRVDTATRTARISYRPAPQDVSWVGNSISCKYFDIEGKACRMAVRTWDRSSDMKFSRSPEGNRSYPEQIILPVAGIDFGIMSSENSMMIMHSLDGTTDRGASLKLDLRKKRVLLTFNIKLPATDTRPAATRTFMIQLDIAQMHKMIMAQGREDCISVIMSVDHPPEVYRKAPNIKETHDDVESGEWNEYNAWYRQTDIDTNPADRSSPIQLRKPGCILDTARWLTYRLDFAPDEASLGLVRDLCQALADYNVHLDVDRNVECTHCNLDTSWAWTELLFKTQRSQKPISYSADLLGMNDTIHLTFPVRYQLEVCLSIGVLHESNISVEFLTKLESLEPSRAVKILEKVADRKERVFDPQDIFRLHDQVSVVDKQRPGYCAKIPSAIVTPTTVYFSTPVLETSNRVVRQYKLHEDRFLRVKFNDERHKGGLHSQDDRIMDEVFSRVYRALIHGIVVGERHYEFLAFGNSQFREHGAYFFASTSTVSAASIRNWMGDFTQFNNVAKYISRLGLCFTTTRGIPHSVTVERIVDIERNGHVFTDGVGKISPLLADLIATHYKFDCRPSVYQFRMAGCKGVLAVDPALKGIIVQIRPSQEKFPAPYYGLEIAKTSKFTSANLNVQLILVLSALGISDKVFMDKLRRMLADMDEAMTHEGTARKLLEKNIDYSQMTLSLSQAIGDGFMQTQEPFIISWLHLWRSWSLKYLKEKARIIIEQGAYVFGVTDETGTLKGHFNDGGKAFDAEKEEIRNVEALNAVDDTSKDVCRKRKFEGNFKSSKDSDNEPHIQEPDASLMLPEIFIQVPNPDTKGGYTVIEGVCLLTRSPTLHSGDVRVVRAIDVPALHHLRDCVVLPQTGDRDLASMCSGGDLDGDEYIVCWDPALIPHESNWNLPAMDFSTAKPPPREGPVTVSDMAAFFVNHIKNDKLGKIAVAHRLWADREDDGVQNEKCIELAGLHSQAVDYPKTGVAAKLPKRLRLKVRPHWADPRGARYTSRKVIGQLYDAIKLDNFKPAWELPFDQRILNACVPSQQNFEDAKEVKDLYDESVRRIMAQYGIKNEFEVFTTFVREHHQELGDYKFSETIDEVSATLRGQFVEKCYAKAGTTARDRDWEKMKPFIVAMYTITAQEVGAAVADSRQTVAQSGRQEAQQVLTFDNVPFMSFPWIFGRDLASIATGRSGHGSSSSHIARPRPTLPVAKKLAKAQATADLYRELEPLAEVSMPGGATLHAGDVMNLHHDAKASNSSRVVESAAEEMVWKQSASSEEGPALASGLLATAKNNVQWASAKPSLCRDSGEEVRFFPGNSDRADHTGRPAFTDRSAPLAAQSTELLANPMSSFLAPVDMHCVLEQESESLAASAGQNLTNVGPEGCSIVPCSGPDVTATATATATATMAGEAEISSENESEIEEEQVEIIFDDQIPSLLLLD